MDLPNSWSVLNELVMRSTEAECSALLKTETRGRKRLQWLLRIHSRLNRIRAHRERTELKKVAKK